MENRNGYFYRKVWVNGTCHSVYIGTGADVELMAQQEEQERQKRQAEREAFRQLVESEHAVDAEIDAIGGALGALVDAHLLVNGWHTHKRQWRKRSDR